MHHIYIKLYLHVMYSVTDEEKQQKGETGGFPLTIKPPVRISLSQLTAI